MDKFWWQAAWGLCLLQLSLGQQQIDLNITCRYAGVFHVEKNGRYSISRTEAADLCEAFNSTLPTINQMVKALQQGFETCRYGFIEGHVVIPRITPNAICAANHTGVYVLTSNTSQYDTYCFNASAPPGEDCTSVTDLPSSFEGQVTITIVNRDGTRYSKKGEYRKHQEDIDAANSTDDDVSSGFSSEKSTPGGYVFHTYLPTESPTGDGDQDDPFSIRSTLATIASTVHSNSHTASQKQNNWIWFWFGNSQSTTQTQEPTTTATTALMTTPETPPKRQEAQNWFSWFFQPSESKSHLHTTTKMPGTESNTNPTGWEPNEENEDETEKYPSFSGSGIDDDEDFISSTISSTPRVSDHTKQNQDWSQWKPSHSHSEVLPQTTARMTDIDRKSTVDHGENSTQEPQPPFNHHEYQDEEETPHATSTTWAAPSSTPEEAATQQEQWFENGWQGTYPTTPSEDSHVTSGATASAHSNHPSQRMTTQSQEDVSWTEFFDPVSHPMEQDHQTERKDMDSSHSPTLQPTAAPNTHSVEDLNSTGPLSVTTSQSYSQNFSTSHEELEEDKEHPTTSILPSSTRSGGEDGRRGSSLPKDATTSLEGYTSHYPDTMENGTLTPVTPAKTGVFGETEVTVAADSNFNVDGSLPGDGDLTMDPRGPSFPVTHGSGLDGHSSESQDGGANSTPGPGRRPQIPEWLIILASLLALALILAVCIAVNSRRRCGQKKKLVINSGNGKVEDRKPSELNGEASKSQEMVHLVNKEPSETPDQCMTADETRNLQNVDMKIGV
ncbi:CD44 antigen isoform X1 [Peromyscus leucopus]|uniref:CD44 antigen isoform X1 n=1 Tax=Peromyscus leucopus TaxID=10041 RepID=UPI001884EA32|nr:CD44 antigen isoform X1 [Peromyscus leucopus]